MYPTETKNFGKKIVTIGGGTGNSILLRGVKNFTSNITTIVTVADDGGGSGVLREDLGMLPPGDIRNCLVALANTEPIMEKLINYRFSNGQLKGQSLGNLLIAAMNDICGDFNEAIKEISNVLAITGKVLPMTLDNVKLFAELEDGSTIEGESNITFLNRKNGGKIKRVFTSPKLLLPLKESIDSIMDADIVLLGPGSLYTSIIPNLLVTDISNALKETKAEVVYILNIMTQPGETNGYNVTDHVVAIIDHANSNIIDKIVVNSKEVDKYAKYRYKSIENSTPIYITDEDRENMEKLGIEIIEADICDISYDYIVHDSNKLMKTILERY
ncbi:uridine diphosphate-N-acetylglucosamine-binding protein YvcK [Finegoldia sp. BIOML-A3]|uniref:gluconeogenesis factor YvcK family protein n=1 Tax=unclassified Finegoldia TaxID=2619637 RepID=UPI0012AEF25F|nr:MULTISPECIES: YvcK family protein [unclassified Finegoldia]MSA99169.1 uridine diphosphate-N-acetylglucosamine-binding protein YvcK [Finegoldia sp. BIOML-A3]MSB93171.1 uridine diphosphate-N-acetylglucosamine-binding protein YvcK [Finegoldia sp. BIOML-A4]